MEQYRVMGFVKVLLSENDENQGVVHQPHFWDCVYAHSEQDAIERQARILDLSDFEIRNWKAVPMSDLTAEELEEVER